MSASNIWFIDLETAPSLGYVWAKWQTDVIEFKKDWYILSFAAKKLGSKKTIVRGLCDYPEYKKDLENDKALLQDLWKIFDEADIIIAHNGDEFDIKKATTGFLLHGLPPPTPYRTIDTKKVAKKFFRFDSNRLDELGRQLGVGRKKPTTGFDLWKRVMSGDPKAWKLMKNYNLQDVRLLERVYALMRPWVANHPNVNKGTFKCPKCGSSNFQRRGFSYTLLRKKQRYQCGKCHGWWEGPATA